MVLVNVGTCFRCYNCYGTNTKANLQAPVPGLIYSIGCVDPIQKWNLTSSECQGVNVACTKFVQNLGELKMVTRACLPDDTCKNYKGGECSTCKADLCNSSQFLLPTVTFVGLVSFALVTYLFI